MTRPMTPIANRRYAPYGSGRQRQIDSAQSADGLWSYERDDSPRTPWVITYLGPDQPAGDRLTYETGTLTAARRLTADPAFPAYLRELAAERAAQGAELDAKLARHSCA